MPESQFGEGRQIATFEGVLTESGFAQGLRRGTPVRMPRVAFIHDWLTGMRGGEKCLDRFCRLWPDSEIFTLLHRRGSTSPTIESKEISTSWLQNVPGSLTGYRYLLPLFPAAARWQPKNCDLVVSLSHCVAKAARAPEGVPHVCYCFTPMRYAWHMREQYFASASGPRDWLLGKLRDWDRRTSGRVTHFVAISKTVARRIRECYDRDSTVVYPPVDTHFYHPERVTREDFYLVVSAFAPYKRLDLAVEACERLGKNLVVIGQGQDEARLRSLAGPRTQFLGWQPDEVIREHYRRCRALLFPGEEDFGIVPVEAQACGAPVIAYARGGATETVLELDTISPTGVLFDHLSPDGLCEAILRFEARVDAFDPSAARAQSLYFAQERFDERIQSFVNAAMSKPLYKIAA